MAEENQSQKNHLPSAKLVNCSEIVTPVDDIRDDEEVINLKDEDECLLEADNDSQSEFSEDEGIENDVYISDALYEDNPEENNIEIDSDLGILNDGAKGGVQDFESLPPHCVASMMNEIVQSVGDILQMPSTTVRLLLNLYKWDSHKMMEVFYSDGQEKMFTKANISPPPEAPTADWAEDCEICYNDPMTKENSTGLQCGHAYHKDCWASYLTTKIMDDGDCQIIRCPGCEAIVDDDLVLVVMKDRAVVDKYWALVTNIFVEYHRNLRWCPTPGCDIAVRIEVPSLECVKCGACGEMFCFKCGREDHDYIPCHVMDMWEEKEKVSEEKGYFSEVLTRQCPGCGRTIEKNKGCNHMRCSCGTEFCWWCLQNHNNHTSTETCINHVRSDTEQDIIDAGKEKVNYEHIKKRRDKYKVALGKTLLAIPRYLTERGNEPPNRGSRHEIEENDVHFMDHLNIGRNQLVIRSEEWLEELEVMDTLDKMKERMTDDLGWFQTEHIKKSIETLIMCQKTLMNMEILVYFLDATVNNIFLVNLIELDKMVRELSKLLFQMQNNFKGYDERKKRKRDHETTLCSGTFDVDGKLSQRERDQNKYFSQDSKDWVTKLVREVEADKGPLSDRTMLCLRRREAIRDLMKDRAKSFVFRTIKTVRRL